MRTIGRMSTTTDQLEARFREVTPAGWAESFTGYIQREAFTRHLLEGKAVVVFKRGGGMPKMLVRSTKRAR